MRTNRTRLNNGGAPRIDWLARVSPQSLKADALAGLTGATLVLPQGVAFAAIAGLPPEYGFYTAMITPVIAALTGSSWHSVSGPTTAISALVFGALSGTLLPGSPEFISAAIMLALLVGVIQIAFAVARLGVLVDFVSHSVMIGFVAGAAILIMLSQIDAALGVSLPRSGNIGEFLTTRMMAALHPHWLSLVLFGVAVALSIVIRRVKPSLPNYLIALAVVTALSAFLNGSESGIATVGALHSVVPSPVRPALSVESLRNLFPSALAIAIVGVLEAMSVARALALRSGQILDANREFLGQGLSNTIGGFFQCYPGSASFTRSGINFDAGAQTPLAVVFAAVFLFGILLAVAPVFAYVPIPGMAGVIVLVAWRLIDFRSIRHMLSTSSSEAAIAFVTFAASLLIDLEFAIYAGVLLSLILFLRNTSRPSLTIGAPDPSTPSHMFRVAKDHGLEECPQMVMARIDGPLYFGAVEHVRRWFREVETERPEQKHMIFVVKGIGEIDLSGANLLIEESERRKARGGIFHLQTRTPRTLSKLGRFKVMQALTRKHIHLSKRDAIASAVAELNPDICATCTARIFAECPCGKPLPALGEGTKREAVDA